jgi:uncharacterized protein (UPF0332 family)
MSGTKADLIKYRLNRAIETYEDAIFLIERGSWNSAINRLYYSAYYAVIALLIKHDYDPSSHNGAKSLFSEHFVKTGMIDKRYGKLFSQLFTWRQKGDYDDHFNFDEDKIKPYVEPLKEFIEVVKRTIALP